MAFFKANATGQGTFDFTSGSWANVKSIADRDGATSKIVGAQSAGSAFLSFTTMPDYYDDTVNSIIITVSAWHGIKDSPTLYVQLFESDETTAITSEAEVTLNSIVDGTDTITLTVTGTVTKTVLDSAYVRFRPGLPNEDVNVSAFDLDFEFDAEVEEDLTLDSNISVTWGNYSDISADDGTVTTLQDSDDEEENTFGTVNPAQTYGSVAGLTLSLEGNADNEDITLTCRVKIGGVWTSTQVATFTGGGGALVKKLHFEGDWSAADFNSLEVGIEPGNLSHTSEMDFDYAIPRIWGTSSGGGGGGGGSHQNIPLQGAG